MSLRWFWDSGSQVQLSRELGGLEGFLEEVGLWAGKGLGRCRWFRVGFPEEREARAGQQRGESESAWPAGPGWGLQLAVSLEPPGPLAALSGSVEDLKPRQLPGGWLAWQVPRGTQCELLLHPHASPAGTEVRGPAWSLRALMGPAF